jgi:tripartite-type tricarboxylate transporter receptor subunit TctC
MILSRRKWFCLAGGAAGIALVPRTASAQAYPSRPVRLIAGFPAGGSVDLTARLIGQWLSDRLGQPFLIENHPGAGSNLAAEEVARAAPDGYTLLECSASNAWNAALFDNLKFDFIRDIAPVASIHRGIGVLVVAPSFPAQTTAQFIAYAKAHPGKLRMASGGVGSAQHLYGKLFEIMAGVEMLHVPYRGGGPALVDLLGGHVDVMFDTLVTSIGYINAGELRALAVTSATRSALLPDIPAIAEVLPGYETGGWQGIGAPKNTPAAIVKLLNEQVNAALADPKFTARLSDLGGTPFATSPSEFAEFIVEYTEKWRKVIRTAGIKAE